MKRVPRIVPQGVHRSEAVSVALQAVSVALTLRYCKRNPDILHEESLDPAKRVPRVVAQGVLQSEVVLKESFSLRYCLRNPTICLNY